MAEVTKYVKKMRNNVAPSNSGFTGDFYKLFWRDIKQFFLSSANYSFKIGSLATSQKLGILVLLPKGQKDKRFMKNWRPITLLNSYYKIISGCLAERIKPNLDKVVNESQKGYVPGRYIGEAIRTTYDCMHFAKQNNKPGLILLVS